MYCSADSDVGIVRTDSTWKYLASVYDMICGAKQKESEPITLKTETEHSVQNDDYNSRS